MVTQVNQCLPSSQTTNQPVTGQTAQAEGKQNMLFFWASLNFTAYQTQPHGVHPTHGEIMVSLSHWKPMVTRQRLRKWRSGFAGMHPAAQARLFSCFPTQTNTHIQAVPGMPLPLTKLKESSGKEQHGRDGFSFPQSLQPQPLSTQQASQTQRIGSRSALDGESTWVSVCVLNQAVW